MTATYGYDTRERCTRVSHSGGVLADYTWLGNAVSKRETTCVYPGSTKSMFKSDYQRDGILRVTKLTNEHTTADQAARWCEIPFSHPPLRESLPANQLRIQRLRATRGTVKTCAIFRQTAAHPGEVFDNSPPRHPSLPIVNFPLSIFDLPPPTRALY